MFLNVLEYLECSLFLDLRIGYLDLPMNTFRISMCNILPVVFFFLYFEMLTDKSQDSLPRLYSFSDSEHEIVARKSIKRWKSGTI